MAVSKAGGTTWTVADAVSATAAVDSFWGGMVGFLPNDVSVDVDEAIDLYDDSTGLLLETVTSTTGRSSQSGGAAGGFAHGVGFRVTWETNGIKDGRRVRGKTYIVPTASAAFDVDGSLTDTAVSGTLTQANTMLSSLSAAGLQLVVWSRPKVIGVAGGTMHGVVSPVVKDKCAVLRNRRD